MKEQIKDQVGTCKVCGEKFQMLDDSGRCESCFDDPTEYEPHPFQPTKRMEDDHLG